MSNSGMSSRGRPVSTSKLLSLLAPPAAAACRHAAGKLGGARRVPQPCVALFDGQLHQWLAPSVVDQWQRVPPAEDSVSGCPLCLSGWPLGVHQRQALSKLKHEAARSCHVLVCCPLALQGHLLHADRG